MPAESDGNEELAGETVCEVVFFRIHLGKKGKLWFWLSCRVGRSLQHGEIPIRINTATSQSQIIGQLVTEATQAANKDRRSEPRIPFFRPVSIAVNGHCYTAFSREISCTSIGLLHSMDLPLNEIEISVPIETGQSATLLVRIERCESCGEGWYISGGKFVAIGGTGA